jgi:hypothetical protein
MNLNDGWNTSNYNLNYLPEEITIHRCILCCEIRELKLQALTQRRENSTDTCQVLASSAARLSQPSYAKPIFRGPQSRHDGKHPDAMMKDFRALLDNGQDTTHPVTMYRGTREIVKHRSCNKMNISDE